MTPTTITLVAGARPNFMKIAPLIRAFRKRTDRVRHRLVDTGQHSDPTMNRVFFDELGIPEPDVRLEGAGRSQAEVTARVMVAMEAELQQHPAQGVLVVGDVNSTLAAAVSAKKLHLPLIHVEAGPKRSTVWPPTPSPTSSSSPSRPARRRCCARATPPAASTSSAT